MGSHDNTRLIRVPLTAKERLQRIAEQERRTMSAQFQVILEEWERDHAVRTPE
jgi:predicted DNA-binding protein